MPVSAGSALTSFLQASRPPAEAPMPTTGKSAGRSSGPREGSDAPVVLAERDLIFWHFGVDLRSLGSLPNFYIRMIFHICRRMIHMRWAF